MVWEGVALISTARPKTITLIPARLESSRLPRKALADILGIPMIVHVYERCLLADTVDEVYVATDSREIEEAVKAHGGKVVMTASSHETGTDRIAEAAATLDADIIVNVQGDEALVDPNHIDAVVSVLHEDPSINVAILVNPFSKRDSPSDIKVVVNELNDVMYLSRADIPSDARTTNPPLLKGYHILPFRKDFLLQYASWEKGRLERIEYHEHLRILEKGYTIRAVEVESAALSVDTEEDLAFVRAEMSEDPFFQIYAPKF